MRRRLRAKFYRQCRRGGREKPRDTTTGWVLKRSHPFHHLPLTWLQSRFSRFARPLPVVSPKPAQSPVSAGQAAGALPEGAEGTEQHQSPQRSNELSCISSGQTPVCSSSPVRGGVNTPVDEVTLSPVKRLRGVPVLMTSPGFGCTSPGKRSNRSPLKDGGHSPARLSPRSQSLLADKLRTPSPVHLKVGSYSPARNSKSWLGFQRAPSAKMEGEEVRTVKSLSVPDLIVYLDESRFEC